ncbi:hypothetical protein J23TS9_09450 [Paenibacillus sp. J23TS9]|uniref:stalk domain-containing protein n=1 Tax=Paenibacillus sp. J23TS9 TaxID=2807193 RepID=UPI001B1CDE80|nr:stalk domain-containing protein [Paenibacillus sp. J23TS9]GIP25815.1 hypothetical protein J23TS9_09450 [Paenibacillus sp. J23TS9]
MKDKVKGLVLGIAIGTMLTGATAFAASETNIKVAIQKLGIYVDGTKKASADAIIYRGTTYVPARSVSNAIGKEIGLVNGGLYIGKQPVIKITEEKAVDLVIDKFDKSEKVNFKVIFMMDSQDDTNYYIGAYEDFPERILIYKRYVVNKNNGTVTIEPEY